MFCSLQISHLQAVLEAVVAVPALWEVARRFVVFNVRNEHKWPRCFL